MFEDNDPKDWEELPEEEVPEKLERKWGRESASSFQEPLICPSCKKDLPRDSVVCLFCGTRVFHDSGLLGKLLRWFKNIF